MREDTKIRLLLAALFLACSVLGVAVARRMAEPWPEVSAGIHERMEFQQCMTTKHPDDCVAGVVARHYDR